LADIKCDIGMASILQLHFLVYYSTCLYRWNKQGCSGAGTRRNTVPANIFESERHSVVYHSQISSYYQKVTLYEIWPIGSLKITEIVTTRCYILRLKCKNSISAGALPQTPLAELTALPRPP